MQRIVGSGYRLAGLGPLMLVLVAGGLVPSAARAGCTSGEGMTGFESGRHTLSVSLPNMSADTEVFGISCVESSATIDPGIGPTGTGLARYIASPQGYRARTTSNVGGEGTGNGGASVLGSARWGIRAQSTPGYTGPSVVDVSVSMQFDWSGAVTVSGTGSAGGTFSSDVTLRPANDENSADALFTASSALAPGSSVVLQNTASIEVDRDYFIQVTHTQNVTTSFSTPPMGGTSSAASAGEVAISLTSELVLPDPELSIEYPMVDLLGVPPPGLGTPPGFPAPAVPVAGIWGGAALIALMMTAAIRRLGRGPRRWGFE